MPSSLPTIFKITFCTLPIIFDPVLLALPFLTMAQLSPSVNVHTISLPIGPTVFYREISPQRLPPSSSSDSPVLLLLHGFPSSSHQYRHLLPSLSTVLPDYRLLAPDFPSFGFSSIPAASAEPLTFQYLAETLSSFLLALNVRSFAVYIFDYGAPVLFRLMTTPTLVRHGEHNLSLTALITQNGNLYAEGLGTEFWAPVQRWWASGSYAPRNASEEDLLAAIRDFMFTEKGTRYQYETGQLSFERNEPEAWTLDAALLKRDGVEEKQMQLFWDYRTNVDLYPKWQKWVRESRFPVLLSWGKNDPCFVYPGAEAFKKDVAKDRLVVDPIDAGHFALEGGGETAMAERITRFLQGKGLAIQD